MNTYEPDIDARRIVLALLLGIWWSFWAVEWVVNGKFGFSTGLLFMGVAFCFIYVTSFQSEGIGRTIWRYLANNVIGYWRVDSIEDGKLVTRYELRTQHTKGNSGNCSFYKKIGGWGRRTDMRLALNNFASLWGCWLDCKVTRPYGWVMVLVSNKDGEARAYTVESLLTELNSLPNYTGDILSRLILTRCEKAERLRLELAKASEEVFQLRSLRNEHLVEIASLKVQLAFARDIDSQANGIILRALWFINDKKNNRLKNSIGGAELYRQLAEDFRALRGGKSTDEV